MKGLSKDYFTVTSQEQPQRCGEDLVDVISCHLCDTQVISARTLGICECVDVKTV